MLFQTPWRSGSPQGVFGALYFFGAWPAAGATRPTAIATASSAIDGNGVGCALQSPRGLLTELAEQEFLGERNAFEFEQLKVLLHPAMEREADLPDRTGEHLRYFDRRRYNMWYGLPAWYRSTTRSASLW